MDVKKAYLDGNALIIPGIGTSSSHSNSMIKGCVTLAKSFYLSETEVCKMKIMGLDLSFCWDSSRKLVK